MSGPRVIMRYLSNDRIGERFYGYGIRNIVSRVYLKNNIEWDILGDEVLVVRQEAPEDIC